MVARFDLITEPWIPCVDLEGSVGDRGLREALVEAHRLREVFDPAPPVTAALHRLLLAVLHRVFGPPDMATWEAIWTEGRFDPGRVDSYLQAWSHRFDLFDRAGPFYQTPELDIEKRGRSIARLAFPLASGHNATLFDHTREDQEVILSPAEAARWLVAYQSYAPGGTVTRELGEGPSAKHGPLLQGAMVLLTGTTLFRTLLLNLVPYAPEEEIPFAFDPGRDRPAWEAEEPTVAGERTPRGYLDLLTWQSRRILLGPAPHGAGVGVTRAVIMKGHQVPEGWGRFGRETMLAFRSNPRARGTQDPRPALEFREERLLWRDSPVLFRSASGTERAPEAEKTWRPRTVGWVAELAGQGILDWAATYRMSALGMVAARAKLRFWRHERLPLPVSLLDERSGLADRLQEAVRLAEEVGGALETAARRLARRALPRRADRAQVDALVQGLAPGRDFWPRLDVPFRRFLADLGARGAAGAREVLRGWARELRSTASDAFQGMLDRAGGTARLLRAASMVEGGLRHELARAMEPYLEGVVTVGDDRGTSD